MKTQIRCNACGHQDDVLENTISGSCSNCGQPYKLLGPGKWRIPSLYEIFKKATMKTYTLCAACGHKTETEVSGNISIGACPRCGQNRVRAAIGARTPPAWFTAAVSPAQAEELIAQYRKEHPDLLKTVNSMKDAVDADGFRTEPPYNGGVLITGAGADVTVEDMRIEVKREEPIDLAQQRTASWAQKLRSNFLRGREQLRFPNAETKQSFGESVAKGYYEPHKIPPGISVRVYADMALNAGVSLPRAFCNLLQTLEEKKVIDNGDVVRIMDYWHNGKDIAP